MDTLTPLTPDRTERATRQPEAAHAPPPLRLPRFLLQHLAKPIHDIDDANRLVAQIRMAQWRGLL